MIANEENQFIICSIILGLFPILQLNDDECYTNREIAGLTVFWSLEKFKVLCLMSKT